MIPKQIIALFNFIDYLDKNKKVYLEKYIPLCDDLKRLYEQKSELKPNINYIDKQQYDILQNDINEKLSPILSGIYTPICEKLIELNIWSGDATYSSIWNNNVTAISDFKSTFSSEDIEQIMYYKHTYLAFRAETNSDFLCLAFAFQALDEMFKILFDFFKDTNENEFEGFEAKTIAVNSAQDLIDSFSENKGKNVKFSIPIKSFYSEKRESAPAQNNAQIKNEFIMGHKIEVGDISNNSGQIIIGNNIKISNSLNGKKETADKIEELINFIKGEPNIDDKQRQDLITNLDKVKEEVIEENPDKSKIYKWLSNTKGILEKLVLTHHVNEAFHWVYENLNFVYHHVTG